MVSTVAASSEAAFDVLGHAIDGAVETPWSCIDDRDLLEAIEQALTAQSRLDALVGELAMRAERSATVQRTGSRTTAIWAGANTNTAPKRVRAGVRRARWLADFGDFRQAHADGEISGDHVDVLRSADTPVTRRALVRDQEMLLQAARDCRFADFETVVGYWRNAADPDGELPREQERRNHLAVFRRRDGSLSLKGELDTVLGTALFNALTAEDEKLRAADDDLQVARTRGARRAHALSQLAAKGATRDDGSMANPLINAVVGLPVLESVAAGQVPELDPNTIDGRCELIDGTPLHPCHLARIMAGADVRRIVLDAESRPIDVSYASRLFPAWMKQVGLVSTRGRCTETGCDAPTHWIHADHRQPHSRGGPTSLPNLDPLCGPGNRAKGDRPPDSPAA